MKISQLLHIASIVSGVIGLFVFLGFGGGGMMYGGMMGYFQGSMMMGYSMGSAATFFLIAIWLQIGAVYHIMLEKKGEAI